MTAAYAKEKRVVFRALAKYLCISIDNHAEWLAEDAPDEPTQRRRMKAARSVLLDLERRATRAT